MQALTQTVHIDDEGTLQDVLAAKGIGPQGIHEDLKRRFDTGTGITVLVPGMPPRAIVKKSAVEELVGHPISGPDLPAVPFS